jgi:O-antigen/teichoic acid export membrane protein
MHIKQFILYTLQHAPWAVLASLCAGLCNYLIIILLSKYYSLEDGGAFRLLLSIAGLLSLATLAEADKVVIRHLVLGKQGVIRPILWNRILFSFGGMVIGLAVSAYFYQQNNSIWMGVAAASLLMPVIYPTDIYAQIVQSRKEYRTLAFYSIIKHTLLVFLAVIACFWSVSMAAFIIAYFIWLAAINTSFLAIQPELDEPSNKEAPLYRRESIQLSFAGFFPVVLEHADKLLVSYFLGLEKLALYTIGISTGRLIAIVIKPTMTVYFPVLVKDRFSLKLIISLFVVLSAGGLIASWPLKYYFSEVLGPEYADAYPLAAIIIAGIGVYFVSVVSYYSSVYHKEAKLSVPTKTSIMSTMVTLVYLVISLKFGGDYALILAALSYPLRDGLVLAMTRWFTKRMEAK